LDSLDMLSELETPELPLLDFTGNYVPVVLNA